MPLHNVTAMLWHEAPSFFKVPRGNCLTYSASSSEKLDHAIFNYLVLLPVLQLRQSQVNQLKPF